MQFTPYWQDGDVCEFGYYSFMDEGIDYANDISDTEEKAAYADLSKLDDKLDSMENLLQLIYGDHLQVTATPDGIITKEIEHH